MTLHEQKRRRAVWQQVTGFTSGDWVIPRKMGLGWWRSCGVFPADTLKKVPSDLPLDVAASLCVKLASAPCCLRPISPFVPSLQRMLDRRRYQGAKHMH
jgi:NADPH:quinone reductase-like Zn-dependent oxidoreductase